ncbi:MAG: hypothetical protein ABIT83_25755 [Massilia sp.]
MNTTSNSESDIKEISPSTSTLRDCELKSRSFPRFSAVYASAVGGAAMGSVFGILGLFAGAAVGGVLGAILSEKRA